MINTTPDEARKLLKHSGRCDRYDYLTAIACEAIGDIIDILFVDLPKESTLLAGKETQFMLYSL